MAAARDEHTAGGGRAGGAKTTLFGVLAGDVAIASVVTSGPPTEVPTAPRIEEVCGQPVDVLPHPVAGVPLVVARP